MFCPRFYLVKLQVNQLVFLSSENDPRCSGQKEEIHPTAQQEVVKNINRTGEGTSISFDISYAYLVFQE